MATVELCVGHDGEFVTTSIDELAGPRAGEYACVWVDVDPAHRDQVESIRDRFDLQRIAVGNAIDGPERARIMLFDDQVYIRSFGLRRDGDEVVADPISLFLGDRFLVTMRSGDRPSLDSIQDRWREEVRRARDGARSSGKPGHAVPASEKLLYAVLDSLVNDYFTVVEAIAEDVEALEDRVMEDSQEDPHLAIQETRARINRLHRMLSPQQEVFNTLLRRDVPVVEEAIIPYFADVHDHLLRCHEWLDTCRDQIASIVDLQQSIQSNRLNRTMRTLTAWSIILMVCGLIAGIYGMNFRHMPELGWRWSYPAALLGMAIVSSILALVFRRRRWW